MSELLTFLNAMPRERQEAFAQACGTTVGYLRKAVSMRQRIGESIVINIERESAGVVTCEELRPDVDWAFLRGTAQRQAA